MTELKVYEVLEGKHIEYDLHDENGFVMRIINKEELMSLWSLLRRLDVSLDKMPKLIPLGGIFDETPNSGSQKY